MTTMCSTVTVLATLLTGACGGAAATDDPGPDAAAELDAPTPDALDAPVPRAGDLDPSFGSGGIVALDVGPAYAGALAVNGDDLLVCYTYLDGPAKTARVIRVSQDGQIDPTFGTAGRLTHGAADDVTCRDVETQRDGRIVFASTRTATGETTTSRYAPDGTQVGGGGTGGFTGKMTALRTNEGIAVGIVGNGNVHVTAAVNNGAYTMATGMIATTSVVRALMDATDRPFVVGVFPDNGGSSWQVLRTDDQQTLKPLGAGARATAGTPSPDLLRDATWLPDGSIFAVGGMDSNTQVMVARFVDGATPTVDVEHHAPETTAAASAVTLDGADRPIVVGNAVVAGTSRFAWQRYQPASITLDDGYQTHGVALAAPPSGAGELVDVVRLGGKVYALGHYDVETASPKLALVRILE